MDEQIIYWIWLQCCLGTDSKKLRPALGSYITPERIYKAGNDELRSTGIFSEKELARLADKDLKYSRETAQLCDKLGIDIISFKDSRYPSRLALISTPPVVLYVKGRLPDKSMAHVGVVGTRNPDETGKKLAYSFGYDLASESAAVISGGAYGVDIFSHRGAVGADGVTVCVLGCGIDMFENRVSDFVLTRIPEKGAVVSEYPPKYPPTKFSFPARNRIISGMSDCIVTVQAGLGSGALITTRFALAQKRKVFAVPGSMDNAFSSGTNYMLRCGFSAALCANDALSWISHKALDPNAFINPHITEKQLNIISTRPENISVRSGEKAEMPPSVCYELARTISFTDNSAGLDSGEPVQTSLFDNEVAPKTEDASVPEKKNEEEMTETEHREKQKTASDPMQAKPEKLISEEKRPLFRNPTYTMDKKTFLELFSGSRELDEISRLTEEIKKKRSRAETHKKPQAVPQKRLKAKHDQIAPSKAPLSGKNVKNNEKIQKNLSEQLTETARAVYDTISDTPVFTDTVAAATGLPAGQVLAALTELEIYGFIQRLSGNKYVKTKGND